MAIEPITRKEQFLAKAGGQQVRDLEPITREEMFLQKIAENSSVQPDLSQNDPTAPDYVKNRLAWTDDPVETVLFDDTVVNDDSIDIELIVGQEYVVTLDGAEYVLTAWNDGDGSIVIGSESLWWENDYIDTEPPFVFGIYDDSSWFYTINEGEEHSFKVVADVAEVHKIDEKYLLVAKPNWNQNNPDAPDYVKNRPFYSIDKEGFVAKEQTIQIKYGEGGCKLNIASAQIVEGKTYIVTLNGTRYECAAWLYQGNSCYMLGNGSLYASLYGMEGDEGLEGMGEDVPFAISLYTKSDSVFLNAEDGTYTISIEGWMLGHKKIEQDYLPSDLTQRIANCKPSCWLDIVPTSLPSTLGDRTHISNGQSAGIVRFLKYYTWYESSFGFMVKYGDTTVYNISAQTAKNANGYYILTALYVDNATNGVYKLEWEQTADINTNRQMPYSTYVTRIM